MSVKPSIASSVNSNKERKRIGFSFQPKNALVLVGTYHSILAGLVLRGPKFALKFTTKHHVGCVNAVAVCDRFIATSGTDEKIFLFTCKNKGNSVSDLGNLAPPAEVRCLSFPTPQFLACGLADGSIIVYKTRDWECAFVLPNVHGKSIEGMAFHPAGGKIAVTIGNDRFVCVLDMNHGKVVTKLRVPVPIHTPRAVFYSQDDGGKYFFVVMPFVVLVYDSMTAVLVQRLEQSEQQPSDEIHTATAVTMSGSGKLVVFIGCEDGTIRSAVLDAAKAAEAVDRVVKVQQPALDAKKPSLASLDKSNVLNKNKKAAVGNKKGGEEESSSSSDDDNDDDEDGDNDDEDGEDESSEDDEDDDEDEGEADDKADKRKKITFEKRPREDKKNGGSKPADIGKVSKLAKNEGPYLQTSSITEAKKKAKDEQRIADRQRKEENQQLYESVHIVYFPAEGVSLNVPAELEASQANAPLQCKRKYPTRHDARVRSLVVQQQGDAEKSAVLISGDTEGCIVAWRIEGSEGSELRYLASANTKSHVTALATLLQE